MHSFTPSLCLSLPRSFPILPCYSCRCRTYILNGTWILIHRCNKIFEVRNTQPPNHNAQIPFEPRLTGIFFSPALSSISTFCSPSLSFSEFLYFFPSWCFFNVHGLFCLDSPVHPSLKFISLWRQADWLHYVLWDTTSFQTAHRERLSVGKEKKQDPLGGHEITGIMEKTKNKHVLRAGWDAGQIPATEFPPSYEL